MLKFSEAEFVESIRGALSLRGQIERIVDEVCLSGYENVLLLGIGGTYASCLQTAVHMKERSAIDVIVENAAEYLTTGNKRIGPGTFAVISSVTGSTEEMMKGVKKAKEAGAKVLGFIDDERAALARMVDWHIAYPENEQLKLFMVADRLMYNAGEFGEYDELYLEFDRFLPEALAETAKQADEFGLAFAKAHKDDAIHYFVGAGNQYGATYSYAMCYWEEQHWLRSKSIHSAEFFHGMFEIVDRDTAVTVFIGEDSQRSLSERVANFLPRITSRYTVIDTKDYPLKGIRPEFRGYISHLVMRAIASRIDVHIERLNCHPMEIRRYYRQLEY